MMHPVLLVHGVYDTSARFRKMSRVLQAHGLGPVHAMDITPSDASITLEAMGEQVMRSVRELKETAGAQQVDIVAFSMGALAARQLLRTPDGRSSVRRLVLLSGPHHGTLTAYLGWNVGARQMRPGSAFLRELKAGEDRWGDVEVFSFYSPFDLVVIPATSSVLDGAHNRAFRVVLHPLMLTDDRVIDAVVRALTSADVQAAGR
jgi:triacylglycerol esterase/lipase EstA (alpha/beta hydrolase family)